VKIQTENFFKEEGTQTLVIRWCPLGFLLLRASLSCLPGVMGYTLHFDLLVLPSPSVHMVFSYAWLDLLPVSAAWKFRGPLSPRACKEEALASPVLCQPCGVHHLSLSACVPLSILQIILRRLCCWCTFCHLLWRCHQFFWNPRWLQSEYGE
jgi:hypothetical protein